MVKTLNTLVKITEYELEEKRKELNSFLNEKERLVDEITMMENVFLEEQKKSEMLGHELRLYLPRFLALTRDKQKIMIEQIERLNPDIERLTDELYEVFTENKKYEILRDQKLQELKQALEKKTQLELDEIAVMKFIHTENLV